MRHWVVWLLLAVGAFGGLHWYRYDREVTHPPGALASAEPEIVLGSDLPPWIDRQGFRYRALGRFSGRVVVVARKNYAIGQFADLAPTDLAIVWGQLSDPDTYRQLKFDQRGSPLVGRFVVPEIKRGTRLAAYPFPEVDAFLLFNLAHVHAIPADPEIRSRLATIRPGQVVRFAGTLVDVTAPDGGRYVSSLALHTYNCEIAWIDELELVDG